MATTTSNFSWPIPQSTDLVKDGATAIASLGSGIDTSMAELKGGTTGQILSKTSGTDMDFTWITPNPGDITGVTAGTGITGGGTSGDVTVSFDIANYGGGQYAAGKNKIINGDFGINQRSFSSTTTTSTYGFDRWKLDYSGGTVTYSAQTFTAGTAPVTGYESTNFARLVTASQSANSNYAGLVQGIEDVRNFANQTVTVSFWAKASTGTPKVQPTLEQVFGSGGSASVPTAGTAVTLSTSWARYSATINVPSISGKTIGTSNYLKLVLFTSLGTDYTTYGNIGLQNVTIDIWGVQVEAGSTATPFQTATGTKQGELAACQRYYIRYDAATQYQTFGFGVASSTTSAYITMPFPVQMRVVPTAIDASSAATFRLQNNGNYECNSISLGTVGNGNKVGCIAAGVASGLTTGGFYMLIADNDTTAYLGWTAEL